MFKDFNLSDIVIGLQYLFVAAGATILVPLLTGIPVSVVLLTSGIGTLIFHVITKGKVPVLLSSSFAFIPALLSVSEGWGNAYAYGGVVFAGIVYAILAGVLYLIGIERVKLFFPTTVTSTMVILIGIILAPVAISNASQGWTIAIITFAIGAFIRFYFKQNLLGSLSVLIAIVGGYIVSSFVGIVEFSSLGVNQIVGLPDISLPKFNIPAIIVIAPVAIVTFLEHFADVSAVSKVVEKDFLKDPGVHKTLLGDGIATSVAGLLGSCPNTTYSENIGALEMTGVKKPITLQIAAIIFIIASFVPFLTNFLETIPAPVVGGISILLFGFISVSGIKGLIKEKVDLDNFGNMVVVASMLVVGIGTNNNNIEIMGLQFSGLALSAITGIVLNFLFNMRNILQKVVDSK